MVDGAASTVSFTQRRSKKGRVWQSNRPLRSLAPTQNSKKIKTQATNDEPSHQPARTQTQQLLCNTTGQARRQTNKPTKKQTRRDLGFVCGLSSLAPWMPRTLVENKSSCMIRSSKFVVHPDCQPSRSSSQDARNPGDWHKILWFAGGCSSRCHKCCSRIRSASLAIKGPSTLPTAESLYWTHISSH
jgi:hypothetical protein